MINDIIQMMINDYDVEGIYVKIMNASSLLFRNLTCYPLIETLHVGVDVPSRLCHHMTFVFSVFCVYHASPGLFLLI